MLSKKIISGIFLLLALVVFSSGAFAQNQPGDKAGRTADMLYKKLNLTIDEYNKVYTSLLDYYTKGTGSWETERSNINSILTKDQQASFASMSDKSVMNPAARRHKVKPKSTDTATKDATKDNTATTKKMDDTKKDGTKKMDDTKKDINKKTDEVKKDTKK